MLISTSLMAACNTTTLRGEPDAMPAPDLVPVKGDPTLARAPRSPCTVPMLDSDVPILFPGYSKARYPNDTNPNLTTILYRCPSSNVVTVDLRKADAVAPLNPSMGIQKLSTTSAFSIQYVVEVEELEDEPELVTAGVFMNTGSGFPNAGFAIMRSPVGRTVVLYSDSVRTSETPVVGITPPYRVRLEAAPVSGAPHRLQWKLTLVDRDSEEVRQGSYVIPVADVYVLFGVSLATGMGRNRLTVSDLQLQ